MLTTFQKIIPGFLLAIFLAIAAITIENLLPIHLIGASVIALFLGILINHFFPLSQKVRPGLTFTSKKILKLSIILLGASLELGTILRVGRLSLTVMLFTLLTCFGGGYFIGRALGLNWKLSNLISAGTGICGGSAIAAIAPAIDATDNDIAYAMSATFLFDMAMILLFPFMGRAMGLSDMAYGLWSGTAINDTSSVVAAGYAFSEVAGDFSTMVKLTRTLSIIPAVIIFALIEVNLKKKAALTQGKDSAHRSPIPFLSLFPWFILGFLLLALINSFGLIPVQASQLTKTASKFFMVASLAAIGLGTGLGEMRKSGMRPMIHGFIISALVVIVAILVEWCMGLV